MQPISAEERAMRLGNVAAILIDLGRRARVAAESGKDELRPTEGDGVVTEGSNDD